jgi:hypothetical protein
MCAFFMPIPGGTPCRKEQEQRRQLISEGSAWLFIPRITLKYRTGEAARLDGIVIHTYQNSYLIQVKKLLSAGDDACSLQKPQLLISLQQNAVSSSKPYLRSPGVGERLLRSGSYSARPSCLCIFPVR